MVELGNSLRRTAHLCQRLSLPAPVSAGWNLRCSLELCDACAVPAAAGWPPIALPLTPIQPLPDPPLSSEERLGRSRCGKVLKDCFTDFLKSLRRSRAFRSAIRACCGASGCPLEVITNKGRRKALWSKTSPKVSRSLLLRRISHLAALKNTGKTKSELLP